MPGRACAAAGILVRDALVEEPALVVVETVAGDEVAADIGLLGGRPGLLRVDAAVHCLARRLRFRARLLSLGRDVRHGL